MKRIYIYIKTEWKNDNFKSHRTTTGPSLISSSLYGLHSQSWKWAKLKNKDNQSEFWINHRKSEDPLMRCRVQSLTRRNNRPSKSEEVGIEIDIQTLLPIITYLLSTCTILIAVQFCSAKKIWFVSILTSSFLETTSKTTNDND